MQASNFGGTFGQLFLWIFLVQFSPKMPPTFFYTMVQKVKMTKVQIKGGPAFRLMMSHSTTIPCVCILSNDEASQDESNSLDLLVDDTFFLLDGNDTHRNGTIDGACQQQQSTWLGFLCAAIAVIFIGLTLPPVKEVTIGDGKITSSLKSVFAKLLSLWKISRPDRERVWILRRSGCLKPRKDGAKIRYSSWHNRPFAW